MREEYKEENREVIKEIIIAGIGGGVGGTILLYILQGKVAWGYLFTFPIFTFIFHIYLNWRREAKKEERSARARRGYMMEEKRGFIIQGCRCHLTLTELRTRLDGTPTKYVLAIWDQGASS